MQYSRLILLTLKAILFTQHFLNGQAKDSIEFPLELGLSEVWKRADEFARVNQMKHVDVEISEQLIKEAKVERLPEIELKGNFEKASNIPVYVDGLFKKPMQHEVIHTLYRVGVDSYLNLYNGNKTNLKIKEEIIHHKIVEERHKLSRSETRLLSSSLYLELQKFRIFKELMIKDIADQEKQLLEITQFLSHGVVLQSDVLRVKLKLSNQKMLLVKIENDIILTNQKLNILIGESDDRVVVPVETINPEALPLKSYEEYLDEAMEKSYQYRISEEETHLKNIHLKSIKGNVAPKIGLVGDFYFANPQIFLFPYNPSLYSLGVGAIKASFPISSFYHNKYKEKAARLEVIKQEIEHHDTADNVRKQVKEAYVRFKESLIRIGVARVNVEQASENLRIINHTYFNQTSLITDLLDADVQVLQTQFELATAEIAAQMQYLQLLNIIGEL